MIYLIIHSAVWVLVSLITASLYKIDKKRAIKNKWRIKESSLLLFSFFFGSLGGLYSLYVLRHKNRHWYFVLVNWLGFMIHTAIFIYLLLPVLGV
ncbi:DUF1294 domain-containing protein [Acholeplasma hippikon]|uniref:Protein of uncharacterized function (DUF1294) n=1 Tax=Acholeplasma hippikon TaxID=264636 RepID=A0A449BIX1_9MOLU|nr:DUF1294 domain-containing protein [Acholeplasma hippikon]VEU82267.1 Protein of uncharacterised function (DUF1294) [Acholeplasma hippikon]